MMKRLHPRLLLILITLIGFALRAIRLDFQPLWWDEGYSVFFATRDFQTMLARTAIDIHPPLYYALMQLWMTLVGKDAVALRWLSVIVGVATIPLIYALARKLFTDARIGLIAALLLALSPLHVYYSQEIRMYGLVTLLGLTSVLLFVQLLPMKPGTLQTIILATFYIVVTAAALYTQYYAAFIIAFEILFAIFYIVRQKKQSLRWRSISELWSNSLVHWIGAWLAIGALYLPWIIYAGPKLYTYVTSKVTHEAYSPLDPITFLAQHLAAFSTGHVTDWTWLAWASVVLIIMAAWGVIAGAQRGTSEHSPLLPHFPAQLLALSYLLVPLALGYLVNLVYPFHPAHGERLLLLAVPAFYIFAAVGIVALWNRRVLVGLLAVALVGIISAASLYDFYTVPRYSNDDYRPLIEQIQQSAQPGDTFLAIYPWQIGYLEAYYTGAPLTIIETPSDEWTNQPSRLQKDLNDLLEKNPRIWIPGLQTLGHILEDLLDASFRGSDYLVLDTWFGTTRLELFQRAKDPPIKGVLKFDDGVELPNWGVSSEPVVAGKDIVRVTYWGQNAPARMRASFRLVDESGNVWAQDDREIENRIQKNGWAIPVGTPPGVYDLRLALYRENEPATSAISLAKVTVESNEQPNLAAIPRRAELDFPNGMRLVGYAMDEELLNPGFPSGVTLYWQTPQKQTADYWVAIQLQDAFGKVYLDAADAIAHGVYGPSRWRNNELVRDPRIFTTPGNLSDGTYVLAIGLIDPATQARIGNAIQLTQVRIKGRTHYFGTPSPTQKFSARFGDLAQLIGYDVFNNQTKVRIVLYWKALASSDTSYTVFVHLTDSTGTIRAQLDQIPGNGAYPTTSWVTSEYIVDTYDLTASPGDYSVSIGMYDASSSTRLSTFDASNQPTGDNSELPTGILIAP